MAQHLDAVGDLAKSAGAKLNHCVAALAELCGLAHDLGKYRAIFQNYLHSAAGLTAPDEDDYVDAAGLRGRIDHSSAGAQLIWRRHGGSNSSYERLAAQMAAAAIASHHSGLIDQIGADGTPAFLTRMAKPEAETGAAKALAAADASILGRLDGLLSCWGRMSAELGEIVQAVIRREQHFASANRDQIGRLSYFKLGLLQRFLFSCLVDADRTDSAESGRVSSQPLRLQGSYVPWDVLCERLETALSRFGGDTAIGRIRSDISGWCLQAARRQRGAHTLSVPTGGGKTLASLRFALNHAREHRLDRVIFVVPYTTIIDQNVDAARAALEPGGLDAGRVVLEHHANLVAEKRSGLNSLLSENWDAPVVYTTMVQFLECLFGAGTQGVRRMHRLARAVIVFDEVQCLPVRCVHLFSNAVNFLVGQAGSSVLLCTATQPLLDRVDPARGAVRLAQDHELVPDIGRLFDDVRRVRSVTVRNLCRDSGWTPGEAAELAVSELDTRGSCLVIVNTKASAREIYIATGTLTDAPVFHLSTALCPAHRRAVLALVRERLRDGRPVLCVSTQLIEAGVDVSFGSVVRAVAGLDAVAQAAGRCNRHGERPDGNVLLVNLAGERISALEDIRVGSEVGGRVLREIAAATPAQQDCDFIGPQALRLYFEHYFHRRAGEMSYSVPAAAAGEHMTLLDLLSMNAKAVGRTAASRERLPLPQAFATAARHFQALDADTTGVVVPFNAKALRLIGLLRRCGHARRARRLLRHAQPYTISVRNQTLEKLVACGAVSPASALVDVHILEGAFYDEHLGLLPLS